MDKWIKHVLNIHFHPALGSPFWIDRAKTLDFDPLKEDFSNSEDLLTFGLMKENDLADRPLFDFIPKRLWPRKSTFIIGETGGTGGVIKTTAYQPEEFRKAFVDNFVAVAKRRGFPQGRNWLYLGPTGPHIIGKAAVACARALRSMEPFTVDFDPRWFGKLPEDSLPRTRYIEHIISQTLHIITTQHIEVLFATPRILSELSEHLDKKIRKGIKGVHFGGMAVPKELYKTLKEDIFPDAVFISGYGNSLFGVALEVAFDESYDITYYPFGERLIFDIVREDNTSVPISDGEEGRLIFSRFDETFMIINLLERDSATKVKSELAFPGISGYAVKNPRPANIELDIKDGLY